METNGRPELIVMLTHHDKTVENALQVFEQCKDTAATCWGFKEHPLPPEEMKKLCACMKAAGKTTFLEVVAYTEEEGLAGAQTAVACGFDVLMGTKYFDSILRYCKEHRLRYMPFVGDITGRPSVLTGSIDGMIAEAKECLDKGADGIDLLAYRYQGDAELLIRRFVREVPAPVCIAGSVDSTERLDVLKAAAPWAFTIGGAFFEKRFGSTIAEGITFVQEYVKRR